MANDSARGSKPGRHAEADREAEFGCSLKELCVLMELRGEVSVNKITSSYGGVAGLCARLRTSPVQGKDVKSSSSGERKARLELGRRRRDALNVVCYSAI